MSSGALRFRGVMGSDDAEITKSIVLTWPAEKTLLVEDVKKVIKVSNGGA